MNKLALPLVVLILLVVGVLGLLSGNSFLVILGVFTLIMAAGLLMLWLKIRKNPQGFAQAMLARREQLESNVKNSGA